MNTIVADFMKVRVKETVIMVHHSVMMQLDYINVTHLDFTQVQIEASKKLNVVAAKMTGIAEHTGSQCDEAFRHP